MYEINILPLNYPGGIVKPILKASLFLLTNSIPLFWNKDPLWGLPPEELCSSGR
jgi:hypothetical protein